MSEMKPDPRWSHFGVCQTDLEQKAAWISRDASWPGSQIMYFHIAASLLRFARFDYAFLPAAFFHAVAGLEGVMRHYAPNRADSFRTLFSKAVDDGLVLNATFANAEPLAQAWIERFELKGLPYPQQLAKLIPALRNEYFHGEYSLSPTFLSLTVQMREAADAIARRP